jgi:hypothetical protein
MDTLDRPSSVHNFTDARTNLRSLLSRSQAGGLSLIESGTNSVSMVSTAHLRDYLSETVRLHPRVHREDGAIVLVCDGLPFAAEASTLSDAVDQLVEDLIDYAAEWPENYSQAVNHRENWALVQLVSIMDPEQVREFVLTEAS